MIHRMSDEEISAQIGTTVANCEIIAARRKTGEFIDSGHYGIALGKSTSGNYATWQFHFADGSPSFYWGRYFGSNEEAALENYKNRE